MATAPDPVYAFAEYAQQRLGVPWPNVKELTALRKRTVETFEHYPRADWYTMCRLVGWCRANKRKFRYTYQIFEVLGDAIHRGALPELDPNATDETIDARISEALAVEADPNWRARLLGTMGNTARADLLRDWQILRGNSQNS